VKSNEVKIMLSIEDEFELMAKYGRKCSRESLVRRAVVDAVKSNGAVKEVAAPKKPRKEKGAHTSSPLIESELESRNE
jgi:hypothetical protein